MKVSKQFLQDFAYIANLYAWTAADIEDVKAQTRANPDELGRYWIQLAAAHRAGYQQTGANNFMRLEHWRQARASAAPHEFRDQYAHARMRGPAAGAGPSNEASIASVARGRHG